MKKLSITQQIINDVLQYGSMYYEIGAYKSIKSSYPIKLAVKTGKVKITASKLNFYNTGFEWVELEPVVETVQEVEEIETESVFSAPAQSVAKIEKKSGFQIEKLEKTGWNSSSFMMRMFKESKVRGEENCLSRTEYCVYFNASNDGRVFVSDIYNPTTGRTANRWSLKEKFYELFAEFDLRTNFIARTSSLDSLAFTYATHSLDSWAGSAFEVGSPRAESAQEVAESSEDKESDSNPIFIGSYISMSTLFPSKKKENINHNSKSKIMETLTIEMTISEVIKKMTVGEISYQLWHTKNSLQVAKLNEFSGKEKECTEELNLWERALSLAEKKRALSKPEQELSEVQILQEKLNELELIADKILEGSKLGVESDFNELSVLSKSLKSIQSKLCTIQVLNNSAKLREQLLNNPQFLR
jgi:hypothetical protein